MRLRSGSCAVPLHDAEINTLTDVYVWERKSRTSPCWRSSWARGGFTTRLWEVLWSNPSASPRWYPNPTLGPDWSSSLQQVNSLQSSNNQEGR